MKTFEAVEIETDLEKLETYSTEIDTIKDKELLNEIILTLKETIRKNNLRGLSAIQVGYSRRVLVLNVAGKLTTYVNPLVHSITEDITLAKESCSSIPGKKYFRPRHTGITVLYETPLGQVKQERFLGAAAVVMQHHLDHLNGMHLALVGAEIPDDWDKMTDEEQDEYLTRYRESLDLELEAVNEEIAKDEEASKIRDALDFRKAVAEGEVELVDRQHTAKILKEETETDGCNTTEES